MNVNKLKALLQQERGVSALYFALVLFLLLGVGAIALDGSNAYAQRRRMQTAADAAAMSGARVLALGGESADISAEVKTMAVANGVGNVDWQHSSDGKGIEFANPGNLDVAWNYTHNNKGIGVTLGNDYDTFFARVLGYDTLTTTATSGAKYEPVVGVDNLLPLAINGCDCVLFDELPVSIDHVDYNSTVNAVYQIGNVTASTVNFALDLRGVDQAYNPNSANRPYYMMRAADSTGTLTEYGDNTARLMMRVVNVNGDGFIVDFLFKGRTATPPDGKSPTCSGACPMTTDWHYYPQMTGTLTGLPNTRYAGAVLNVVRRNGSAQVGTNAHLNNPLSKLGAFGDLQVTVATPATNPNVSLGGNNMQPLFSVTLTGGMSQHECQLYPIALSTQSLNGIAPGTSIPDIYNGVQPGNFGWLTWKGAPNTPTLVTSLTPPGDSNTYVNPNNSADHLVSVGDWVQGSPGVANANGVRRALNWLMSLDITVPVWDQATGVGNNSLYHVVNFANVRITSYRLPNQNRITATFLGYNTNCLTTPPPPNTVYESTPCQLAWLDWNGGIASTAETADYIADPSKSGYWEVGDTVPAGPNVSYVQQVASALDQWINKPATIVLYGQGSQQNGYQICGFAEFTMTAYDLAALPKWLQGSFTPAVTRGATSATAADYGLRSVRFQ